MATAISNTDNIIDSRDVIARIEELTEQFTFDSDDRDDLLKMKDIDQGELGELIDLKDLQEEAESYCEWRHGATLVHADYFVEYIEQYARDTGAVSDNAPWPINYIDWQAAADEFRPGYTTVEFGGQEYLVRSS